MIDPFLAVVTLALSGAALPEANMIDHPPRSTDQPRPRADDAILQGLNAARRAGTVEACDLFIARHPGHALAALAHGERERLRRRFRHPSAI